MKTHLQIALIVISMLSGCATVPATPVEAPISVQLRGTSVEVQQFIEDRIRKMGLRVESATDRAITFKSDCMNVPDMNALKCSLIMMAIGNSRWDGPHALLTFRTSEVRGVVNLTGTSEWCATNPFGKTNCIPNGPVAQMNMMLHMIDGSYRGEVRPL